MSLIEYSKLYNEYKYYFNYWVFEKHKLRYSKQSIDNMIEYKLFSETAFNELSIIDQIYITDWLVKWSTKHEFKLKFKLL